MRKPALLASVTALILSAAASAAAQTPASAPSAYSVGVVAGAQSVEKAGGLVGVEISRQQSERLGLFVEGLWLQNVVTRRRSETIASVASYLADRRGVPVTGTIDAPAGAVTAGARLFLRPPGGLRPYVAAQVGMARVTLQPTVLLGGSDVTTTLDQYGVTLGEDLTGSSTRLALGGGVGVLQERGRWTIDASVRLLNIQTDDQATNVARLSVALSRRF